MNRLLRAFLGLLGAAGCAALYFFVLFEGEGNETYAVSSKPLSVRTIPVEKRDYRLQIPAYGVVMPREVVDIRAEVAGRITDVPENSVAGGVVEKNQLLFTIDERDYQIFLEEAFVERSLAEQALEIEKGRQIIARKEWELLEQSGWNNDGENSLALRKPQLEERQAAVRLAEVKVAKAELALQRTRSYSPCDGVILEEQLAPGRLLDAGDAGMRIGCTERYHVNALFPQKYELDANTTMVSLIIDDKQLDGTIRSVIPEIDAQTRNRQALVEFVGRPDIGAYANLFLPGSFHRQVTVVPREALRADSTVWLVSKRNTLEVRKVEIIGEDLENVVIGSGLEEEEHLIVSHVASPLEGMRVERQSSLPGKKHIALKKGVPEK
ncbi:MAG: efflux RND transporter periplasmic adaptor subunit [Desulfopila sp.]|jgi:RND family efflux transporter MFP subunit|nr:efflux RND transporter periplasmic adaptor subunit [Desulfopila sp.]